MIHFPKPSSRVARCHSGNFLGVLIFCVRFRICRKIPKKVRWLRSLIVRRRCILTFSPCFQMLQKQMMCSKKLTSFCGAKPLSMIRKNHFCRGLAASHPFMSTPLDGMLRGIAMCSILSHSAVARQHFRRSQKLYAALIRHHASRGVSCGSKLALGRFGRWVAFAAVACSLIGSA